MKRGVKSWKLAWKPGIISPIPENTEVTNMFEKAGEKADPLYKKVDLRLMDAHDREFPDAPFDTIVITCVFCSVPDPVRGLSKLKWVCKKSGRIMMLEHVRSGNPVIDFLMNILNPVVVKICGANINHNTVENLRKAGLQVEEERDLMMDIVKHLDCKGRIDAEYLIH